jgi:hypothetical protein
LSSSIQSHVSSPIKINPIINSKLTQQEINKKYGLQNFYINTSIKLPIKEIIPQKQQNNQTSKKSKLSNEELKQKYELQDFYIDASIYQPIKKRKIKPTFSVKELIKNKRI